MSRPIWPRSSAVAARIRSRTVPATWPKYSHQSAVEDRKASSSAATEEERGQIGRDIYTYLHLPIIAGIVLVAVGDEFVIAHPTDDLHGTDALVALGGPALFLGGLMACAARLGHAQSLPRAVAVVALLAVFLTVLVVAERLRGAG